MQRTFDVIKKRAEELLADGKTGAMGRCVPRSGIGLLTGGRHMNCPPVPMVKDKLHLFPHNRFPDGFPGPAVSFQFFRGGFLHGKPLLFRLRALRFLRGDSGGTHLRVRNRFRTSASGGEKGKCQRNRNRPWEILIFNSFHILIISVFSFWKYRSTTDDSPFTTLVF